jgi:hypothetical protein
VEVPQSEPGRSEFLQIWVKEAGFNAVISISSSSSYSAAELRSVSIPKILQVHLMSVDDIKMTSSKTNERYAKVGVEARFLSGFHCLNEGSTFAKKAFPTFASGIINYWAQKVSDQN